MLKFTLRRNDAPSYRITVIEFPALENELAAALGEIGVGITTEKNLWTLKLEVCREYTWQGRT